MAGFFSSQEAREDKLYVCLDLGSHKIKALAAVDQVNGERSVVALEEIDSDGIKRGIIFHPTTVSALVKKLIGRLENKLHQKISKVYVTTGGIKLNVKHNKVYRHNNEPTFSQALIDGMEEENQNIFNAIDTEILLIEAQQYRIDQEYDITNPVGSVGKRLDCEYLVVAANKNDLDTLRRTLKFADLDCDIVPAAYAAGLGVLNDDEKQVGAVAIDMGAGISQMVVFHDRKLVHLITIPFAGDTITNDLRTGWNLHPDQAERLKVKFGSAVPGLVEDAQISLSGPRNDWPDKKMMRSVLTYVVEARLEEMFSIFVNQLERINYFDKLGTGIVLTGGTSYLGDLDVFVTRNTGLNALKSKPATNFRGSVSHLLHKPEYAVLLGLLQEADEDCAKGGRIIDRPVEKKAPQQKVVADKKPRRNPFSGFVGGLFAGDQDVSF